MSKGYISEIFESFEGEGINQGILCYFIRFSGCNLDCQGCDTSYSKKIQEFFEFEGKQYKNPIEAKDLKSLFNKIFTDTKEVNPLVLTGGEPLLQVDFLKSFLETLSYPGIVILETNGTLPDNFLKIEKYIDFVSMDWKLEGTYKVLKYNNKLITDLHKDFLIATKQKKTQIKLVVNENTLAEFEHAINSIYKTRRNKVNIVIQPFVDENNKIFNDFNKLKEYYLIAKKYFPRVKVSLQMHKFLYIK